MLLHTLLRQFDPQAPLTGVANPEIKGVREDSRLVRPGDLFVARAGSTADGRQFVQDAIARGAAAVVAAGPGSKSPVPVIPVKDPGAAASVLANLFLGNPGGSVKVLGVTGTNGKTTTTYLIRHILGKVNRRCGMVGTVEIDDGRTRREASMTTPSACDVADLLATMRDRGCRACAIETSSHALDQGRVAGVPFAAAAFTNLTGDHLDYHKTMDAYADAKAKLFASLDASAVAVVNSDDDAADRMVRDTHARVIRFGFGKAADYRARDWAVTSQGSNFVLHTPDGRAEVAMGLIGKHNIENALAAAALVGETFGLSVNQIAAALRDAEGAPGRLQAVRVGQPFAGQDAARVKAGQTVMIDGGDGLRKDQGTIAYISPFGAESTQTLLARVILPNADGNWRPGLFVTGEILLEEVEVPLAVKTGAVQTFRDWTVVFVNEGNFYEPLVVKPGRRDGEWVEIVSGMKPGLRYVAENSFIIKADILKAGASHDH